MGDDHADRDESFTRRTLIIGGVVAAVVVVIDQLTKALAVTALADEPISLIADVLQLALTRNTGASFSILTGNGTLIALVVVGVIVLVVAMLRRVNHRLEAVGLGLVLGGAIGNLLDRIFRGDGLLDGAVIDFIDFSFFPTFNVADTAINVGVILLLIAAILRR